MQTFRISRRTRVWFNLLSLGFLAASIAGIVWVISEQTGIGLMVLCLAFASFGAMGVIGLLSTYRSLVEISEEKIRVVYALSTKELRLNEIAGFRLTQPGRHSPYPTLLLIPKQPKSRRLKIDLFHERRGEILTWAAVKLRNLDVAEHASELAAIAADERLGFNQEQRLLRVRKARRIVNVFNVLAVGAAGWAFFAPRPYGWVMGLLIILPLIACVLRQTLPHAVRFDGKNTSAYPQVCLIFMLPALALSLRSFLDADILHWSSFWIPWLTVGLAVTAWIISSAKEMRAAAFFFTLLPFTLAYSYGAVIHVNCFYDHSATQTHLTTVLSKREARGKGTQYHLKVAPWIDQTEREVRVGPQTYARHHPGSQASIHIQKGALSIPFYFVR